MPGPEAVSADARQQPDRPVAVVSGKRILHTAMPGIDILAVVQDNLGFGVGGDKVGRKHRARRIRDGDRMPEYGVKLGLGNGAFSVEWTKPPTSTGCEFMTRVN